MYWCKEEGLHRGMRKIQIFDIRDGVENIQIKIKKCKEAIEEGGSWFILYQRVYFFIGPYFHPPFRISIINKYYVSWRYLYGEINDYNLAPTFSGR